MSKVFYDHLVIREEIDCVLNNYRLDKEEKEELIQIIDQTLHHHILNVVLNHLPKDIHREFIELLNKDPGSDALMDLLKIHSPEVEFEIKKQAQKVKREILDEIHKNSIRKSSGQKKR
jgi:hypothetical protein